MMENSSQELTSDGVFSRPPVPGVSGLPRARQHRYSGGGSVHDLKVGGVRIKTEPDSEPVKVEAFYGTTDRPFPPPSATVIPRRRDTFPRQYMTCGDLRASDYDMPLNLASRATTSSCSAELKTKELQRPMACMALKIEASSAQQEGFGARLMLGARGQEGFGSVDMTAGYAADALHSVVFHGGSSSHVSSGFGPNTEKAGRSRQQDIYHAGQGGGGGGQDQLLAIEGGPNLPIDRSEGTSSRTVIEFDGNDCVLCRVCGDKASGFHYGVHSCEGCKGFFRRSIQQKIQYRPCSKNQQCSILRINRNRCQYCRLKKCIAAGMSRDAVRFGRVPKREKAKILAAMQSSKAKIMENRVLAEMADERKIIDTIVRAHYDTCDYTAEKIKPFISKAQSVPKLTQCTGQTCPMKGGPELSFLDEFSDRFMDHVRQVCSFAKSIPGFKCLQHDDQVTLLKSCVFEVLTVRLSGLFDNQSLVCLNGDVIRRETISAMPAGNAKFLMDNVFELAQRINRFRLSDAEIGLFCSVVIISADRPGLRNPELVGRMQGKLKNVLQNILVPQHPLHTTIFSELLTIIHDLRTLNTLHTEKFLQQAKVTRDEVQAATSPASVHSQLSSSGLGGVGGGLYDRAGDWEDNAIDGDSIGSRSPQSSGSPATSHSFSMEDLRRSPMGSVSSSESLGSSETFCKLSVNDLKIHGVGSVLLNALTSPALSQVGNINRKRKVSRSNEPATGRSQEDGAGGGAPTSQSSVVVVDQKCPFKTRKLDSPSDSGIDSPKAQGSQSTNTSVCSSPRSSMEETQGGEEDNSALEEQHPLLKRALQQPPQPFGVTMFQDEVYKPHKKFRHNGRRDGDEPTSTQDGGTSPGPSLVHSHSILASQLAAPPTYSQPAAGAPLTYSQQQQSGRRSSPPPPSSSSQSLLATTLSRPVSVARAKRDEERSELLANLILDSGRYRPPPPAAKTLSSSLSSSSSPSSATSSQSQSLLMCAPLPAHSNIPDRPWSPQSAPRHLPVPVAPTQPTSTLASPRTASASRPPTEPQKSSQLRSALTEAMPLNLSVRTPPPSGDAQVEREKA